LTLVQSDDFLGTMFHFHDDPLIFSPDFEESVVGEDRAEYLHLDLPLARMVEIPPFDLSVHSRLVLFLFICFVVLILTLFLLQEMSNVR